MDLVRSKNHLQQLIGQAKEAQQTIAFVPTMGALHAGHLSLVQQAAAPGRLVVVSIFVNPTQFNDPNDLEKYPRTLEHDLQLLQQSPCDVVFAPEVDEMYPDNPIQYLQLDLGLLATTLEGLHRPGHFDGVVTVVHRLFQMVQPHLAFFGQKDYQQLAVVRSMVQRLALLVEVIGCPIVREADGLAMSSRNVRLSAEHRAAAPRIFQSLDRARALAPQQNCGQLRQHILASLAAEPLLRTEYVEIVDPNTLQPHDDQHPAQGTVALVAVWAGPVRLIDNMPF